MKIAVIKIILNKTGLDKNNLNNYRLTITIISALFLIITYYPSFYYGV